MSIEGIGLVVPPPRFLSSPARGGGVAKRRRGAARLLTLLCATLLIAPGALAARHEAALRQGTAGAYLAARFAMSQGDAAEAASAYATVLAADPRDHDLIRQAFTASFLDARPDAVALARRLPDDQVAQLVLANADIRAEAWSAAEAKFRALGGSGIAEVLLPVLTAWCDQAQGRTDAALATLRPRVEASRLRSLYALHAGLIADLAHRTADAARYYGIARTSTNGANLRQAQILASWEARQGHTEAAAAALREVTDGSSDLAIAAPTLLADPARRPIARASDGVAEAYLALAAALWQQHDQGESVLVMLRLALDLRPGLAAARLLTSEVLETGRNQDAAVVALQGAAEDDPLLPLARLRRVELLARADSPATLDAAEALARDYQETAAPYAEKADVLREKGRFDEAAAAYTEALAHRGGPARAAWSLYFGRAVAYERSHRWPEAETDLKAALALSPDQPSVLNYLAYSWAERGENLDRARQMLGRALSARPNEGAFIDSLGWVAFREGDTTEAIRLLERASETETEDATVNDHLGDAYWAAGRRREARFQWERAMTLKPEPEDVPKLEAKLKRAGDEDGADVSARDASPSRQAGTPAKQPTPAERSEAP